MCICAYTRVCVCVDARMCEIETEKLVACAVSELLPSCYFPNFTSDDGPVLSCLLSEPL
jgi:hypothetical protein